MKQGTTYWMNILSNFRKGELLIEAIEEEEAFLRFPKVVSPLASEDYRLMAASELPDVTVDPEFFGEGGWKEPLWDGVVVDKATRKILFVSAFSSPDEIAADCPDGDALWKEMIARCQPSAGADAWLHGYFSISSRLAFLQYLQDPRNNCLANSTRAEMFLLFLADDYTAKPYSADQWKAYEDRMWKKLTGDASIMPRGVFSTVFSVGRSDREHDEGNASSGVDLSHLSFLGLDLKPSE